MQLVWFFAFDYLAVNAFKIHQEDTHLYSVNSRNFSIRNGSFEWVDEAKERGLLEVQDILGDNKVRFLLYTSSNPDQAQEILPNSESIKNSNFKPSQPTVFFAHGWKQDSTTSMSTDMRHAYFKIVSVNFIFLDWSVVANKGYLYSKNRVPAVGESLANMFDRLVLDVGVDISKITVIGHSLGSHVAGFCGKKIESGKVARMFALDPASPLYHLKKPELRFGSKDAKYTVQITTNGNQLGFREKLAQVAIYVNGGQRQPGCDLDDHITGLCSHRRSVDVFIESINSSLLALVKCDNYKQALAKKCGTVLSNEILKVTDEYYLESGVYHLLTNEKSPYGTGKA